MSSLAFLKNRLYIASRTKSRIAVIDYSTLGLETEFTTVNKPIGLQIYGNNLYVLGAQNNVIQRLNTDNGKLIDTIDLATGGFSSGFNRIQGTDLAVVTDIKKNMYSILDLSKGKVLKTYTLNVPINDIIITNKVRLFD